MATGRMPKGGGLYAPGGEPKKVKVVLNLDEDEARLIIYYLEQAARMFAQNRMQQRTSQSRSILMAWGKACLDLRWACSTIEGAFKRVGIELRKEQVQS